MVVHCFSTRANIMIGGEYVYGISPFRQMLEARSVDIVMIDLVRVGGITQWMKVAGMAEAFNLPVVSHLIPEIHVHLIAAIPNGHIVEYMPWTRTLVRQPAAAGEERDDGADAARPWSHGHFRDQRCVGSR
jgi:L-alanine-DL-glutamate epimerase-like enolase superfamily enzyme